MFLIYLVIIFISIFPFITLLNKNYLPLSAYLQSGISIILIASFMAFMFNKFMRKSKKNV